MDFNRNCSPMGSFAANNVNAGSSCGSPHSQISGANVSFECDCECECKKIPNYVRPSVAGTSNHIAGCAQNGSSCSPCHVGGSSSNQHRCCTEGASGSNGVGSCACNPPCENTLGYAPNLSLAMAYVPDQKWECIFDCETALERGTLFEQLDKPLLAAWRC